MLWGWNTVSSCNRPSPVRTTRSCSKPLRKHRNGCAAWQQSIRPLPTAPFRPCLGRAFAGGVSTPCLAVAAASKPSPNSHPPPPHLATFRAAIGPPPAPVRALRALLADRDTWVKLSGAYRLADQPGDARLAERGRMLVQEAPDRMVWGSDWPHVACAVMPDAGELLNMLADWFDADQATLQRILVDNPARLFDFPAAR